MMPKKWTHRIGVILAALSLLSVLASQVMPQGIVNKAGKMAAQDGFNVFTVIQTFSAGMVVSGMPDTTAGDVSTSAHGWMPKCPGGTSTFFRADCTYGTVPTGATLTRCANIDPASTTTSWFVFKAKAAITVTAIDCIVDAATSVVLTMQECDSNGANCGNTEAAITCATTNTAHASSIDDSAIDAGDWVRVTRGTVSGSPTQAMICFTYTEP